MTTLPLEYLGEEFMYRTCKNGIGPRTECCGTQYFMSLQEEIYLF
jgi:hypothetical protein